MKIVPKLTLALVGGTCMILAVNAYLRVRREVAIFEADRLRNHEMIGRALAGAATQAWKSEGERAALAAVAAANEHPARIQVRWVPAAASAERGPPLHVEPQTLAAARAGEPITRVVRDEGVWYTYVPVDVGGERRGVVELSERAEAERRFADSVFGDALRTALALVVLSALLSFVLGQWLVGAPVRVLAAKARRIGRGDFAGPVRLDQNDELGELSREINAMCERLAATLEQLRHADRLTMVGKLASGIAHELGTPLNVVSARAQMIAAGDAGPEEAKDYARVIVGAAERMTKIIRQLLQFARRKGIQKTTSDVRALTNETLELLRPLAAKHRVELEVAPGEAGGSATVDAGQLQQVVTNLVMNAIQAIKSGGHVKLRWYEALERPPPDVSSSDAEQAFLCLDVADDGEGIAPDHVPRVFEPFFTTKDVGEGTGLGLAVSYGIVREHGGFIRVASVPGEGTTFTVLLPRVAVEPGAARADATASRPEGA